MSLFKITQMQGSKTITSALECKDLKACLDLLNQISTAKVVQIQQIVYESDTNLKPVDDFNYMRQYKALAKNDSNCSKQFLFHHVKKNLNDDELIKLVKTYCEVDGKKVSSVVSSLLMI